MAAFPDDVKNALVFLKAYPYPAYVLETIQKGSRVAVQLEPIWSNPAYDRLIPPGSALLSTLSSYTAIVAFGSWVESSAAVIDELPPTHLLKLDLGLGEIQPGYPNPKIELEVTKTELSGFLICTSVPRTPLPSRSFLASRPKRKRKRLPNDMKLLNLPSMTFGANRPAASTVCGSTGSQSPSGVPTRPESGFVSTAQLMETFDWASTALGPRETWPIELHTLIKYINGNPHPNAIWWGSDLVLIYNDAYAIMATTKHPKIYGQRGLVAWGELWDVLGPALNVIFKGDTVYKNDDLLFFDRLGPDMLPEETYHSWSWVPVHSDDGVFQAGVCTTFESTQGVLAERRMSMLQSLGSRTAVAQTTHAFTSAMLSTLEWNPKDIPFAAFYLTTVSEGSHASTQDMSTPPIQLRGSSPSDSQKDHLHLSLEGTIGVPDGHLSIPAHFHVTADLFLPDPVHISSSPGNKFHWPVAEAILSKETLIVDLPPEVVQGFHLRGWRDLPRAAAVVPLSSDADSSPLGVLIMGLNTRRTYDQEYSRWVDLTRSTLCAMLTATKAREEEAQRLENLAELDAAKTALFSNASHELRTPLTLINAPIRDLLRDVKDIKQREKLNLAARNIDRLSRLVDSLMDFSRLEAGRFEGRFSPMRFGPFVADLAALFRPTIEKSKIQLTVHFDQNEERVLFIDPDLMEKIVFNLIGNAFKYTLVGSIEVEVVYAEKTASIIVRDTGVGIPNKDIVKIFDRFHRVEAVSRSYEGTGIGLSLTKQFVQLHGGSITVKSVAVNEDSEKHGSVFTAAFPLGQAHLCSSHVVDTIVSTGKRSYAKGIIAEAARWRNGDGQTPSDSDESYGVGSDAQRSAEVSFDENDLILVVDDNADMLDYIKGIFAPCCKVRTASNGRHALEVARRETPHLILSDLMMPLLDGYGLLAAVRDDPELRHIPIILLTARVTDNNRVEGILSGADDFLPKPFSSRELLARANLHLQLGKRKRQMELRFEERSSELCRLMDLTPVGIFRVDTNGHLIYCNESFKQLSGLPRDYSIIGEGMAEWMANIDPESKAAAETFVQDGLDNSGFDAIHLRFKNGIWVKAEVAPVTIPYSGWVGLVGTLTDMTLTRLYEESLKKRAEEAEERRIEADQRRRGQELLVDVTSHELRQPVSAIINCSSTVKGNLSKHRAKLSNCLISGEPFIPTQDLLLQLDEDLEGLTSIELCGLAQGHIVNDILTLSQVQLNIFSLVVSQFSLKREVKQVCSILFNEMRSKGIQHNLTFGTGFKHLKVDYVAADKVRFGQVIINLLSNAIKFSQYQPRKQIDVHVDVSRHAPTDGTCNCPAESGLDVPIGADEQVPIYVYISVRDSGPGLHPKDLELLFQRFQRGSNTHEVFGGSGLGLFVSRKICDLLGGKIEVDPNSVGNDGSTFRFYLQMDPVPPAAPTPRIMDADIQQPAQELRVLLAEDNMINRRILTRQLEGSNCIVDGVEDGAQAIEAVVNAGCIPYDCILMDCEMPVLSGLDATREIRRREALQIIPTQRIIALTANARPEQIKHCLTAGMDDVMTKPYKLLELLQRMRRPAACKTTPAL